MPLTVSGLVRTLKKQMDDLAHSTLRNPPANMEELMKRVGQYQAKDELIALVQSSSAEEGEDP